MGCLISYYKSVYELETLQSKSYIYYEQKS
jgi:hypothetical protein